jgi:signal transduction histidine kinase
VLDRDFAVILLDVNMPGMDGFETGDDDPQAQASPHTPIIFMTAYSDEMHAAQAYSLGAVRLHPHARSRPRCCARRCACSSSCTDGRAHPQPERPAHRARARAGRAHRGRGRGAALGVPRRGRRLLTSTLDRRGLARDLTSFACRSSAPSARSRSVDEHQRIARTELAWSDPDTSTGRRASPCARIVEPAIARRHRPRAVASARREVMDGPVGERTRRPRRAPGRRRRRAHRARLPPAVDAVHPLVGAAARWASLAVALRRRASASRPTEMALGEELAGASASRSTMPRLYLQVRDNDRRKDEFLAMLAHELRSPAGADPQRDRGAARRAAPRTPRLPWARDVIDRQSRQLMRIVDDLLDVSRITSGKIQLKTEDSRRGHGARLRGRDQPPADRGAPPRAHGDAAAAAAARARRFRAHRAGDRQPAQQRRQVHAARAARYRSPRRRRRTHVVFSVKDTGLGIPAPMLDGIFDLFTQLDTTLDRAQGGLGIGLTLVKRLVEAQGGKVQAASAGRNQGSEFTVWLPLVTQRGAAGAAREATAQIDRRSASSSSRTIAIHAQTLPRWSRSTATR